MSNDTITVGEHTFEIVEAVPLGYEIWNIGTNMPDGFLPFCRLSQRQPFLGGRNIETDTLKAIKTEGAQLILAVNHSLNTIDKMESYIKRYRNAKPGSWAHLQVERIKKALPYMRELNWG